MNTAKRRFMISIAALAAFLSACDEGGIYTIRDPYKDAVVEDPHGQDSTDGNSDPGGMDDSDKIQEDEPDSGEQNPPEPCTDEEDCGHSDTSCDICTRGSVQCRGDERRICVADDNGCLVWKTDTECQESGGWCDAQSLSCMTCEETCQLNDRACSDEGVMVCRSGKHGCPEWSVAESCGSEKHCDEITLSCVEGCKSVCHAGEMACEGADILSCQKNSDGCMVWSVEDTCDAGSVCVPDPPHCDRACGDSCEPFSIIILPDTQNYGNTSNGIHKKQTQWIADNKDKENIRMVVHVGDVSDGNRRVQYERAVTAQNVLAEAGIPFAITTGNHDYKQGDSGVSFVARDRSLFGDYFNDAYFNAHYTDHRWFHGFGLPGNMAATFEVGHLKFAVLTLEFFPRKDALCWAEELISTVYKDHYVILVTHGYLTNDAGAHTSGKYSSGSNGDIPFGAMGTYIYSELVARHSNIILVISGHVSDSEHRVRTGYNHNKIVEMLVDYQSEKPCTSGACTDACGAKNDGGNGWMRQLKIDPVNIRNADGTLQPNVEAITFSALDYYQNQKTLFCSEINASSDRNYYHSSLNHADHQFSFTLDFTTPPDHHYSTNDNSSFTGRNINAILDDTKDGNQYHPAIAMHRKTGSFVAVWEDDADNDGICDIQARAFCQTGCVERMQFIVNDPTTVDRHHPDIAMDEDGNILIVWEEHWGSDVSVYMRGYDAAGHTTIPVQRISGEGEHASSPAVAMAYDGTFAVTWQVAENALTSRIAVRGFTAGGSERFYQPSMVSYDNSLQVDPDIAMDRLGRFVITWADDSDQNGAYDVMAKGFEADGTERLPIFTVNTIAAGQQRHPAIGMNEDGTFYIAFEDDQDGNGKYLIITRGFDASGREILADKTLTAANEEAVDPAVCVAGDGKAIFGWTAQALNAQDVQKRILSKNLTLGSESSAATFSSGPQITPAVGCTASGSYVFLYSDDKIKSGYSNIIGRGFQE